jgi:dihydrofolate reductase
MIMGRRTFESIGRPLPGRESIVVSRSPSPVLPTGVLHALDPDEAARLAAERADVMSASEIALIGGAELFAALLPRVGRLYMTYVDLAPQGDAFFPEFDISAWREVARSVPEPAPGDEARCVFIDYVRA